MSRNIIRTVSAALSAVITIAVLHGVGMLADIESAAYPQMLARAKAKEHAQKTVSVASVKPEAAPR